MPPQSTCATTEDMMTTPHNHTAYGAHIYRDTRHIMNVQTPKLLVIASRGFARGNLPTRRTTPPLSKRRHSIDANTTADWGTPFEDIWDEEKAQLQLRKTTSYELDLPFALSYYTAYPHPGRYAALGLAFQLNPPYDESVYLELGDAAISNAAFHNIGFTNGDFFEAWMQDVSLDMGLEVICRETDCNDHGIAIATTLVSQICLYAANSEDSSPQEYSEYKSRLQNRNWVFVVVTDGESSFGDAVVGSHWSLLVLDRLSSVVYYFDSMFVGQEPYQEKAYDTSRGMLKILGEDIKLWEWRPQLNSPHQIIHNQIKDDIGACGPFVLQMTELLIDRIKDYQSHGKEHNCRLELDEAFANRFRVFFHSGRYRRNMQKRIAHYRAIVEAPMLAVAHDHTSIHGLGVELDDSPVVAFQIPRRAKAFHRYEPRQSDSHQRVRLNRHQYISSEDENYVVHHTSSGGGDTEIIELSDSEGDGCVDIRIDGDCQTEEEGDEDGGSSIYDAESTDKQYFSSSLLRTTNPPIHSDDENIPVGVTSISSFDMDSTVDMIVSRASKTSAQSDDE